MTKRLEKKRQTAMKKYFTASNITLDILRKPCPVEIDGVKYISFCNTASAALTTEVNNDLVMCEEPERYPNVARFVKYEGEPRKLDLNKAIAEAKEKGYKLTKSAMLRNDYLMYYDGLYFRIPLVEATYNIINDGAEVISYRGETNLCPLVIKNDIGIGVIMPLRVASDVLDNAVIIEVKGRDGR